MIPSTYYKSGSLVDNFPQIENFDKTNLEVSILNLIDNIFEDILNNQDNQLNSPIYNSGMIATGEEDDLVLGISASTNEPIDQESIPDTSNLGIFNTGLIQTNLGNDTVFGSADTSLDATNGQINTITIAIALQNQGLIDTGDGNDQVLGTAKAQVSSINEIVSLGIINTGLLSTGIGNDKIIGKAIATNENETTENSINTITIGVQNHGFIDTGDGDDEVLGIANIQANSINKTISLGIHNTGLISTGLGNDTLIGKATNNAIATISNNFDENEINTLAIGIQNQGLIKTGDDNDKILGIAEARNLGELTFNSPLEFSFDESNNLVALSTTIVAINAGIVAIGVQNSGATETGNGDDYIIGIANSEALSSIEVNSQVDIELENNSFAIADSEASRIVDAFAIGIENQGRIETGQGNDYLVGIAGTLAVNDLEVNALANNFVTISEDDFSLFEEIEEIRGAQSISISTAINQTTTQGIINTGLIDTGIDDDILFGLANSSSSSNVEATSFAESIAQDVATAITDLDALAVAEGYATGIANFGKIVTGEGNDLLVGIADNGSDANISFEALAFSSANSSVADLVAIAVADTINTIAIGIDNSSGLITTEEGDDQIIGFGNIGITGGNINTGQDNDSVIGYGDIVGVERSTIELGEGDDFFKAAIVDSDPLIGEISQAEDQSGSIINASVWGGSGSDTFEIGGFGGYVVIDGGLDHDIFRFSGSFDDFVASIGSSNSQSLSLENADSLLTIRNVEEFQFADSDRTYSFSDFA